MGTDSAAAELTLGPAVELFLAAKRAEGASPKTIEWYRMVLGRATRELGAERPIDALTAAEVRDWLLALRETLAPISIAGYVRGLKVFGNWCAAPTLSLRLGDGHGAGVHLIAAHIASIAEIDPDAHFGAFGQFIRAGGLVARIGRVTR